MKTALAVFWQHTKYIWLSFIATLCAGALYYAVSQFVL